MTRKKIAGDTRKALILEAARHVFSVRGFEAARTQEIARQAKISEALVYRHFPSKLALYRAVLRQTIREQDENYAALSLHEADTSGVIKVIKSYFSSAVCGASGRTQDRYRILLSSLSGDGTYAKLIYRRAQRKTGRLMEEGLRNARAAGDIQGEEVDPGNSYMFIEHIGTMMSAMHALALQKGSYVSSEAELLRQTVWFCCRGMGFTDEAIAKHIDS
jgi:AcrR family transcriptional regulator